jgi:hypothetical protein
MMVRAQISLDPEQHRLAKRRAAELGISLAEYLRRLVAADVGGRLNSAPDTSVIFDLGDSGGSDVARNEDRYLSEVVDRGRRPAGGRGRSG